MRRTPRICALTLLLELGCPLTAAPRDDTGSPPVDCPATWTEHEDGVWLQPHACLAMSPRSEAPMDWYTAASPESSTAGGCSAHCAEEPGWCDDLAGLGGIARWRLPSLDELAAVAAAAPPLTPLDGYLWSRDSSPVHEDMASQIDLSQPYQVLLAGKDQEAWVRCVADLR
jgi:hypothetical protein